MERRQPLFAQSHRAGRATQPPPIWIGRDSRALPVHAGDKVRYPQFALLNVRILHHGRSGNSPRLLSCRLSDVSGDAGWGSPGSGEQRASPTPSAAPPTIARRPPVASRRRATPGPRAGQVPESPRNVPFATMKCVIDQSALAHLALARLQEGNVRPILPISRNGVFRPNHSLASPLHVQPRVHVTSQTAMGQPLTVETGRNG